MSLQEWVRNGWASERKSTGQEIQRLLALADRDLASCATAGLAADWRFAIAYNAALQSATAGLAAAGGASRALIRRFDAFRKKRNLSSYEMGGTISEKEVAEMAAFAADLRQRVERWVREKHPELKL